MRTDGVRMQGAQHMQPQHFGAIGVVIAILIATFNRNLIAQLLGGKFRRERSRA